MADSVQDKRDSQFIALTKRQYSGNVHGMVRGIGLVKVVHSSGVAGDFLPLDYRVYAPAEDQKTKNDHFPDLFDAVAAGKVVALSGSHQVFSYWAWVSRPRATAGRPCTASSAPITTHSTSRFSDGCWSLCSARG